MIEYDHRVPNSEHNPKPQYPLKLPYEQDGKFTRDIDFSWHILSLRVCSIALRTDPARITIWIHVSELIEVVKWERNDDAIENCEEHVLYD